MANIKSAKKRVRVNLANEERNKAQKSYLKTVLKKADVALAEGSADCTEVVNHAFKVIDKACAKHIIHKNNAARKKSALASKLNARA